MDRKLFYNDVRNNPFSGKLIQDQVDGMEAILDFWENPPFKPEGEFKVHWDIRSIGWLAYILATTYHETAFEMQPISERGGDAYFTKYEGRKDLCNTEKGDGAKFHGRGFVQITGRCNYTDMTRIVRNYYPNSPDFTKDPEAVKELKYATLIMFYGMFNGTFTGKALKHYIGDPKKGQIVDYFNARRVVNRLDKARKIERYAKEFEQALFKAGASV